MLSGRDSLFQPACSATPSFSWAMLLNFLRMQEVQQRCPFPAALATTVKGAEGAKAY